jgi:hypothetical protein
MFLSAFSRRPKPRNRLAYVFYATDDIYAVAVLVFVRLLRDLGARSDADILVMHAPLSSALREKMQRLGITTRLVRRYPKAMNASFRHCLLKLKIFGLSEYERVLFADADAIPLKSLDHLLSNPMTGALAAPRAYWLPQPFWTSALLVAQPSRASWKRVRRHFGAARRTDYCDMDIVNRTFADEIQTLPPATFCLNSEWEEARRPGFFADPVEACSSVSVVHFTALGKPWTYTTSEARRRRPNAHPQFYDLWDKWRTTRDLILG